MPSWLATCCIRRRPRSFSVSANFTTKLEEAPCKGTCRHTVGDHWCWAAGTPRVQQSGKGDGDDGGVITGMMG